MGLVKTDPCAKPDYAQKYPKRCPGGVTASEPAPTCATCASTPESASCLKAVPPEGHTIAAVYTSGCCSLEENGAPLGLFVPEGGLEAVLSAVAQKPSHFASQNLVSATANTFAAPDALRQHLAAGLLIQADVPEDVGTQTIVVAITSGFDQDGGALTAVSHTLVFGVGNGTALLLPIRTDRGRPQFTAAALRQVGFQPFSVAGLAAASTFVVTPGTIPSGMVLRARLIGANDPIWSKL